MDWHSFTPTHSPYTISNSSSRLCLCNLCMRYNRWRIYDLMMRDYLELNRYYNCMQEVHIGHYILGRTIGTGGFAKVKQARHDITGVRVAVKIINKRKMKNKNMISKVKREIKILKFINHENIIKLYEVLDTTNDIFVIMELAEGGELYDYIQNNDITEQDARFFFKQIISGVAYAHNNLIAHRDLKPENILIDSNKLIKIVDFGLSNLMKNGRLLKTACGSPNYAAPEIVGQRKYEGTSVDVWSCGVILYALLVGSLPFDEETVTLLYRKIEQGIYSIPHTLNPLAADLIARMLQVDPYKRIRIHEIAAHPWLRSHIPIYAHMPIYLSIQKDDQFQIDEQIYEKVKKMNIPIEANDEKIKKSIKKRDDESFVITYELLKDQKFRKQKATEIVNGFKTEKEEGAVFKQIHNTLSTSTIPRENDYIYGKRFTKPPKILAEILIGAFRKLEIDYSIKNPDYCMECTYYPRASRTSKRHKNSEMLEEREEIGKQDKFSKTEIKFLTQIFSIDPKGYDHIVDLQLSQGHPLMFFNLSQKVYKAIEDECKFH